ncbi:MAG TPA: hypothetical protein VNR38_12250 [Ureibacillus sp.]|nr:hypothetical protein [Ureibacillus sp.]
MGKNKDKDKKSPLETGNVQYHQDEEFGTTVLHPEQNNSKKLSMKEVLKKMDENNRGMA